MTTLTNEVLQQLKDAVGPNGYLEGDADTEAAVDARELYHGKTALVLPPQRKNLHGRKSARPPASLSAQGETGYCGGATPDETRQSDVCRWPA